MHPFAALTTALLAAQCALASPLQGSSDFTLNKRDDPFVVQVFGPGENKPKQEVHPARVNSVIRYKANCGEIVVTSHTQIVTQCEFFLPKDLAGGIYRGRPAGRFFTISAPASCAGRQIGVGNRCTGCGAIGELPNKVDCHGKPGGGKNVVNLCQGRVGSGELIECGSGPATSGGGAGSTTCVGVRPCVRNGVCFPTCPN